MFFQAEITSILETNELGSIYGERRRKRVYEERYRVHEEQLQRNHGRATVLDYSEIRQITSQYIGYLPYDELMSLTPNEWKDWVIGRRLALLDEQENLLFGAQANGLVQAGKSLKRLQKQLERARYEVRGQSEEYERMKERKLAHNKRIRNVQKQGTRRFMNSLRNTSQKGG